MKHITDEDFRDVTESGNKLVIFSFCLIIIGVLLFGYFFVFKKFHFVPKNMKVEIGSELSTYIGDYLTQKNIDISGYKLDTSKVKTSEIGEYTYTISYNKITKKGHISIVDTTPPVFTTKDLTVEQEDENFYLGDFLETCEDASKPCLVSLKNENDADKLKTVGTHSLDIVVSDIYKNNKNAVVNVNVVEKGTFENKAKKDLEFATSSEELPDFKDEYYIKLEAALPKDSEEAEDTIETLDVEDVKKYYEETYDSYTFKEAKIVEVYNKSDYIIGFVVKVTINNGKDKIVYYTKPENEED